MENLLAFLKQSFNRKKVRIHPSVGAALSKLRESFGKTSLSSMSIVAVSTSTYSTSSSSRKYDVFLSFRGEDTRKSFTSHLYSALIQSGINVFIDDKELERGKCISPELLEAIEESRFSVVVFSRNYATSTWCLDELVKIVECMKTRGQKVIPVFYDVDPSIVRKQTGNFGEAFIKHEEIFRENIERVQTWRNALTEVANRSGFDLKDRHESEFIQEIVKEISTKLRHLSTCMGFKDLVGIDSRLEKLKILIGGGSDDVRMIGIYGMGGIGKTTIARIVYELLSCEFEGVSFLVNVREMSEKHGLISLQNILLSQIQNVGRSHIDIHNIYDGVSMLKGRLKHKKVLVIIDDAVDINQLNALAGKHDWFGLGSRIIITTRDKKLLTTHGVDKLYKVEELNHDDSIRLFSLKAFKSYQPSKGFVELSNCFVKYAHGLPLALEVLGSFLYGRPEDEWISELKRLDRDPENEILDILQISFDELKETEKKIFLDVACFFKGYGRAYVTRVLDGCGFSSTIGISVLIEKSLVCISNGNCLWMHDLLQEMGQHVVRRESIKEPGKRSRLWNEEDIRHVLTRNTGTEVVEGLMLNSPMKKELHCSAKAFSKMINLRLLKIKNVQLPEGLEYLPNELRLFDWHGYPLKSLPSNFRLDNVVTLNLSFSPIRKPWKGTQLFNTVTSMSFKDCQYLKNTPDFTQAVNLEEVILKGCRRLRQIHPSLLVHKNIALLDMTLCTSLTSLPENIHMESLKGLQLSSCSKLKKFPNIVGSMDCLSELALEKTAINELPLSIELLTGLTTLNLSDCKNLITLPRTINGLKSLEFLQLSGCSKLEKLPETLGQVESLWVLEVCGTAIRQPMSSIFLMKRLQELDFRGCKNSSSKSSPSLINFFRRNSDSMAFRLPSLSGLSTSLTRLILRDCNLEEEDIPSDFFNSFSSLWHLELSENNFVSLPGRIKCLSKLQYLYLDRCKRLQSLPELPSNIRFVNVDGCTALETLSNVLGLCNLELSTISFLNCLKLTRCNSEPFSMLNEHLNKAVSKLREIFDVNKKQRQFQKMDAFSLVVPGSKIPEWFNHQSEGCSIKVERPPYIYNKGKFVGYVACSVFALPKHPPLSKSQYHRGVHWITCTVNVDLYFGPNPFIRFQEEFAEVVSHHLWILYFPRHNHKLNKSNRSEHDLLGFRFETSPGLEMKRCGFCPIYEDDVKEFYKITSSNHDFGI